jgi:hypothetical protein
LKDRKLITATIRFAIGAFGRVSYGGKDMALEIKKGESVAPGGNLQVLKYNFRQA